jgi:hypothetical protein
MTARALSGFLFFLGVAGAVADVLAAGVAWADERALAASAILAGGALTCGALVAAAEALRRRLDVDEPRGLAAVVPAGARRP